jgi:hypothetical protein
MRTVPAATPAETGKNKGQVASFDWVTAIAPDQNVTGLPIHKSKNVAVLQVPGDALSVEQFDTYSEVREAAGEHYESWVLNTANTEFRKAQLQQISVAARKLTVAPANILDWARSFTLSAVAFFTPTVRAKAERKSGVTAQLAAAAQNLDSMSREDLAALILKLAAK